MSKFKDDKIPDRPPQSKAEVMALVLVSLFFGGMFLASIIKDFSVFKVSIGFFLASWVVLLVLHEFGHALMARALGWSVSKVCIGTGKIVRRSVIFGMPTEFRAIPLSGYAVPCPTDLIQPRLKQFLIYAAGPGIELVAVGFIAAILGPDTLLRLQPNLLIIGLQSFCVAALFGAFINLIPLPIETDRGKAASDGLGMILAWSISDAQFAEWIEEGGRSS